MAAAAKRGVRGGAPPPLPALLLLLLLLAATPARAVVIDNAAPRRDRAGRPIAVQDGCLASFGGRYYLYGVRYQCCPVSEQPGCYKWCAWANSTFVAYSSPDLSDRSWVLESEDLMPAMANATSPHSSARHAYFTPCVLYSRSADHYVLWFIDHWTHGVAVGASPVGPFTAANWGPVGPTSSDMLFWQDPTTEKVYMKLAGPPLHPRGPTSHLVAELADDLLSLAPNRTSDPLVPPWDPPPGGGGDGCSESGGIFERGGRWFVMAGACCCFCRKGGNAWVWAADAPLGPYTYVGDLIGWNASAATYATAAQQFGVAALSTRAGVVPMYVGLRWGAAPDGVKCHDPQYWHPMAFDGAGMPRPISFTAQFDVDIIPPSPSSSSPGAAREEF